MTVFDEICGTRVQYVFRVCYLNDSIDFLPLTDYKKNNKPVEENAAHVFPKTFKISYRDPSKARFTIGSFHNICLNFNLLKPFVLNNKTAITNS